MDTVNMVAVIVAALASVAIGAVWYGPLFGKLWRRLLGLSLEDMKKMKLSPLMAMAGGVITAFLMAYVLAHGIMFGNIVLNTYGVAGAVQGAFWYWLGFALPLTAGSFLWEGKSVKLWVLNAGYYLVSMMVMAVILGSF